jgi:excisionase family DNA binding protein
MDKQTYNINEISVLFGMSEDTIRRGIQNKEIPVIRVGRRLVIPKSWAEKQMGAK